MCIRVLHGDKASVRGPAHVYHVIGFYTVNVTALYNACDCHWLPDLTTSHSTIHSILNNGPQPLNFSRANSKEAVHICFNMAQHNELSPLVTCAGEW